MQLSIVIVNYKVPHLLLQCLDAVHKAMQQMDAEVFVVDNHSEDGSQALVEKYFPDVKYIANSTNVGFAKANNQAIAQAKGKYVLLLNPDTIIAEDTLQNVCHFAQHAPAFGALGVRMIDRNGKFLPESKRNVPTLYSSFCKLTRWPITPRKEYYCTALSEHQAGEVPVLSGAFMLLNKEALGYVALLDERYFMYGEDIDLSYAITRAGFKNYYFPCTIVHYKGESTHYDATYRRNFYGAMQLFYEKYYGKGLVNGLIKLVARLLVKMGGKKKQPNAVANQEVVTLSTQQLSYADIIAFFEQNKGEKQVKIEHPTLQITV